jgi:hypothetical protein
MINQLKLYYSINDLISDDDLQSLIKNYSINTLFSIDSDSIKEYKTELWSENKKYGIIIFNLEIKYDSTINYYTFGFIKILLEDNIYIEGTALNEGPKIDFLINKLNIKSNIYMINNKVIESGINIDIDFIIKDNNTYGIITLTE